MGDIDEAFKCVYPHIKDDGTVVIIKKEDFITSLEKAGARTGDNTFDLQKFSLYYCE